MTDENLFDDEETIVVDLEGRPYRDRKRRDHNLVIRCNPASMTICDGLLWFKPYLSMEGLWPNPATHTTLARSIDLVVSLVRENPKNDRPLSWFKEVYHVDAFLGHVFILTGKYDVRDHIHTILKGVWGNWLIPNSYANSDPTKGTYPIRTKHMRREIIPNNGKATE